jgi:hypothetical protein
LGKVRIHQGRETHVGCEAFSLAAFEYDFGALDRLDNPITETYLNPVYVFLLRGPSWFLTSPGWTYRNSAFGTKPPLIRLFVLDVAQYFPYGTISWLFERDKKPGSVKIRENRKQVHAVARTLIDAKRKNMGIKERMSSVCSVSANMEVLG